MPGYKVNIKEDGADFGYLCTSCGLLLRDPKQTHCGHRYCTTCVEELTRSWGRRCRAYECGEEVRLAEVWLDKAAEQEALSIAIFCNNIDVGCRWEGIVRQLMAHLSECDFEKVPCVNGGKGCKAVVPRKELGNHVQFVCDYRYKESQENQGRYDRGGRTGVEVRHRPDAGDSPNMPVPLDSRQRQNMMMMQNQAANPGANPLVPFGHPPLSKFVKEIGNKKIAMEGKRLSNNPANPGRLAEGAPLHRIRALENRLEQERANVDELRRKIAEMGSRGSTFEGVVNVLGREIEKCSSQMEAYERQRRQDREIIETLERKIRSLERIIALKDVALAEQDLRTQTLELTSYDGILTWKIPDFTRKRHDAIAGKTTSFYSPCFFTSRTGYKMCARIYLNGDGMGKGTHVSLFFVVMRGHYDGLLRWPFQQKVTFMIVDQDHNVCEHVIDAFLPDSTHSSFQRPTSDMNIASGCPLFVPLSQLESSSHAYVRDDTMFVKIIVDTTDL